MIILDNDEFAQKVLDCEITFDQETFSQLSENESFLKIIDENNLWWHVYTCSEKDIRLQVGFFALERTTSFDQAKIFFHARIGEVSEKAVLTMEKLARKSKEYVLVAGLICGDGEKISKLLYQGFDTAENFEESLVVVNGYLITLGYSYSDIPRKNPEKVERAILKTVTFATNYNEIKKLLYFIKRRCHDHPAPKLVRIMENTLKYIANNSKVQFFAKDLFCDLVKTNTKLACELMNAISIIEDISSKAESSHGPEKEIIERFRQKNR